MWARAWIATVVAFGVLFIATGHITAGIAFIVLPLLAAAAGRRAAVRRQARMTADDHDLLTVEQVAEILGQREDWVLTLVARDGIPHVKRGPWYAPDFRFDRNEIEEWLQQAEGLKR